MSRKIFAIFLGIASLLTSSTFAADIGTPSLSPPPLPEDIFKDVPDTTKERLSLQFTLGKFSGAFEETRLDTIHKLAGSGIIQHQGDAGESIYSLCYTLISGSSPQRLWIISSGEMGGKDHKITEIAVENIASEPNATASCPKLPEKLQPISIDRVIRLNMSRHELVDTLGKPSKINGEWLIYSHAGKVLNNLDELGWLVVHIRDDRVIYLRSGKTTTN